MSKVIGGAMLAVVLVAGYVAWCIWHPGVYSRICVYCWLNRK